VVGALAERRHVVCFVRPSSVQIVDNWDTLGLADRQPRSRDRGRRAPHRARDLVFDRAPWTMAPLYRVPIFGLLATGIAAARSGSRGARSDHVGGKLVADSASAMFAPMQSSARARRGPRLPDRDHHVGVDRASVGPVDGATRGELRLAASFVRRAAPSSSRRVSPGWCTSVRAGSVLGNALRDVETLLTHAWSRSRPPATARAMLGVGTVPGSVAPMSRAVTSSWPSGWHPDPAEPEKNQAIQTSYEIHPRNRLRPAAE